MASNEKITMRQLQILIILGAMGTGVIVLPRRAANLLGSTWQDGWLIALGLTVVAMIIGALICFAIKAVAKATAEGEDTPPKTFIESTGILLTKPLAYFIGVALWAKLVLAAGLEMRVFMEIVREILLPNTPMPVVSAIMLAVCAYAAAKGIETRARVAEVLILVMILPSIFLFICAAVDANFSNLQPVLVTPPQTLITSILRLGFIFTGMEMLLLVSPFLPRKKPLVRPVVGAVAVAGGIITLITMATIVAFGRGVANEAWPVLRMMDMINIPGSFIERQEALMFSFWIITAFVLGNAMLFFGGILARDILQFKKNRLLKGVLLTAVGVFAISNIPFSQREIYQYLDYLYLTTGVFFLIVLPILLIIAAKISTWGKGKLKTAAFTFILAIVSFTFTACWDRVEMEDRAFVVAMGIDKCEDDNYIVSLSVPILGKSDEEAEQNIKTAEGETITEALKKLDAKTDKQLYYGQAKLLILGTDLLESPRHINGVINVVSKMPQICASIYMLAADDPTEILEAKPPGETLPGLYVSELFSHKNKLGGTAFALDFEGFSTEINSAIIPQICTNDDELELIGAVVVKDSNLVGKLTPEELRGFLWCIPQGNDGAVVTANQVPMKVESHEVEIIFDENLHVVIKVTATGNTKESTKTNQEHALSAEIASEITHVLTKLQREYKIDALNLQDHLRKTNYPLYKAHTDNWQKIFESLDITPRVNVLVV
ncbi:MAG: Ger(x)C family spore germination protein [Defluviitaleaceae bacterium]|nr:Ger(x)C family spore germination protein [Defluviitaleaceae bacterium]